MQHRVEGLVEGLDSVSPPIDGRSKLFAKRVFDIVVGVGMLIAFLPLMVIISALIYIYGGPGVIYAHRRIGRDGQAFNCLKFRTMYRDADVRLSSILDENPELQAEWQMYHKLRNDPRIIPVVGHKLRKLSLDELPQIFNVIRGEMSIVGPRPVTEDELVYYGPAAQLYTKLRPGLTGPWQVGDRNNATFDSRVRQDVDYVRNWNLRRDLAITVKTALKVLRGSSDGAF